MATEYNGINYFPLLTGFFHSDIMELTTAMFGIKGPHAVIMLLCKIYTEGYYIQWGYKYHSHSPKALILSPFIQKYGFCRVR